MPDHLHVLAAGAAETSNLVKFVEAFKQETAVELRARPVAAFGRSNITTISCAETILQTASRGTSG